MWRSTRAAGTHGRGSAGHTARGTRPPPGRGHARHPPAGLAELAGVGAAALPGGLVGRARGAARRGVSTYYHTDALGSPIAATDESGVEVNRRGYTPWGAPADGDYVQGPGYTGHVTDHETQLSYMQQRYYDPIARRFLAKDPISASAENFNRYAYAGNNPFKYVDPDGRCRETSAPVFA